MNLSNVTDPAAWLADLYTRGGAAQYGDERVSQLEHALQCAQRAEAADSPSALIAAALLHDVGHMLHKLPPAPAEHGVDDRHESIGGGILATWFPPEVSEPVRLHVNAKRYLCAVDTAYHDRLSFASQRSLRLQGGTFAANNAATFIAQPHAPEAVLLRQWDEGAKVPELATPDFAHFMPLLRRLT
jgi:phosphonate degradation associated HDIG domain protein